MVKFIADIGSNHNGDLDRAIRLVEEAARVGCSAVKFQLFDNSLARSIVQSAILNKNALPLGFLTHLRGVADSVGIEFHLTITNPKFIPYLAFAHAVKIGSYEILCLDLIRQATLTGLPIYISTGGANTQEIKSALHAIVDNGGLNNGIVVYHCSPKYPALPIECNMMQFDYFFNLVNTNIQWRYNQIQFGWSDHTTKPGVIYAAIYSGASVIELHMDLDGLDGWESEHGHCWEASRVKRLIKTIKDGRDAIESFNASDPIMRMARTDPKDYARPLQLMEEK